MLTEQFIASLGVPTKPASTNVHKDAAIFVHEHQPLKTQRSVFKKSATAPNCLAVTETHVFAAQAEKAVVHVYSREKGNQEATVPFTERITCIILACDDTVLVLGTAEGRIFLWEIATGRQVTSTQSHLQAVTELAVDPKSNSLLSASADSTVLVWSVPSLLSFSSMDSQLLSPLRTFSSHRSEIAGLVLGHSSSFCNIAVSASKDKTCFVWDYHNSNVFRTYLLPDVPTCIALDAADRAIYIGYEDGSIQQLHLYDLHNTQEPSAPVQPPQSSKWTFTDKSNGAALAISLSFDGCTLLSGHESGAILRWDVGRRAFDRNLLQMPFPGPITNMAFLPVTGFGEASGRKLKVSAVVKPKFGAFDGSNGAVSGNYALSVELASTFPDTRKSDFEQALTAPTFPAAMLEEGLNEVLTLGKGNQTLSGDIQEDGDDFVALENQMGGSRQLLLEDQNVSLKAELEALRRLQKACFEKIDKINAERKALTVREQKGLAKRKVAESSGLNGIRTGPNGSHSVNEDLDISSSSSDDG